MSHLAAAPSYLESRIRELERRLNALIGSDSDVWHDLRPLLAGFSGSATNEWPPQYRRTFDGYMEIFGAVQLPSSGSYNGVVWGTIPAAYAPARYTSITVVQVSGSMSADTTSGGPRLYLDSSGSLTFNGIQSGINGTMIRFSGRWPVANIPITS